VQLGSQIGKYLHSGNRVLYDADRGAGLHRTLPPLAAAVEGLRTSPLRSAMHAIRCAYCLQKILQILIE